MKTPLLILALSFAVFAQLSNIRIINDNLPDYTDIMSLVNSIKGTWQTDEEKALAAFKWVAWGRHQAGVARDSAGAAVLDPVIGYNHYGIHNCGPTTAFMAAVGQGLGFIPSTYCCAGHTLIDLTWGGKKHLLDASFGFYFVNKATREIAGFYDLRNAYRDGGGSAAGNPMLDPLLTGYFCPTTTYPVPNGTAARMGYSIYEESNRYIQGEYKEFYWDDPASFDTSVSPSCYGVNLRGYRYGITLKPYESYTRYFHPLGSTSDYYLAVGGVDPNLLYTGYGVRNCRSNGRWDLKPDFGAPDYSLALAASANLEQGASSPLAHPSAAGVTASMTLRVDAANPITSARISGSVVQGSAGDVVRILISTNSGSSWQTIWTGSGTGVLKPSVTVNAAVAHRYAYLVKLEMSAATDKSGAGVDTLLITTITQLNAKCQPFLTPGVNRVAFMLGSQSAGAGFRPVAVTYAWTERRKTGDVARSHTEIVADSGRHNYEVHAAGPRWPRMEYVRVAFNGFGNSAPAGYSDGKDTGAAEEKAKYHMTCGWDLAYNADYTWSVAPDVPGASAPASMKMLTNGMAPKSDSLKPTYSSGWTAGLNPDITLDLGSAVDFQGVRILQARGKNDGVYADSIQVFTSPDNSAFAYQGAVFETDVWNPPTGYLWPSMWDSPSHDSQPYGGIYAHHFPLCFSGTVNGRYVRFRMFNDNGPVYLSSLQVLDRMTKRIVTDEFNQGFTVGTEKQAPQAAREAFAGLVVASNPFARSTVIMTGYPGAKLEIFDQSGRLIRRLTARERVVWDGRDALGRVVPAGVYFIRLQGGTRTSAARIVKL